jgi:hypothetical protein
MILGWQPGYRSTDAGVEDITMTDDAREALRSIDLLLSQTAPYEQVRAALDACAALPGAESIMPGIAQRRLATTTLYQRSDEECEQELRLLLNVERELMRRTMAVLSACKDRPRLLAKYMPELIDELDQAAVTDSALSGPLEFARQALERIQGGPARG